MNSTKNDTNECESFLFSTDPFEISLNILRIGIFVLYVFWLLFAFCFKEMRNKHMSFLINLNAVGIIYCLSGMIYFFHNACSIPSIQICIYMNIFGLFIVYYSGYSISALAMYRMLCCYLLNIRTQLKNIHILLALLLTWSLPVVLACIHQFGFKSIIYYSKKDVLCLYDPQGDISSIIFLVIFSALIPNLLIFTSYILLVIKLRRIKNRISQADKRSSTLAYLEPPRVTIQLIIYLLAFQYNCSTNIIELFRHTLLSQLISIESLRWIRLFRWLQHICPLGLLYFHPVLLEKYKKLRSSKA